MVVNYKVVIQGFQSTFSMLNSTCKSQNGVENLIDLKLCVLFQLGMRHISVNMENLKLYDVQIILEVINSFEKMYFS